MQRNNKHFFMRWMLAFLCSGLMMTTAQAGTPLWTFEPLTETTLSVPTNVTSTVQYRVTNQSNKPHTLAMKPVQGVTQITTGANVCGNPFVLQGKGSCILSLQVNGSELNDRVTNAPVVCQQGSNTQCYRPSSANVLRLTQAEALTLAIDPANGTQSGGTGFTLTGTGFTGATGVTFDGVAATSVNVVNSTTVTGVTPARALSGVVDVVIELPAGSATLANGYTYEDTAVGQASGGGTIACLEGGFQNLIAATADNSAGIAWGGSGTVTGATSTTDGATNTTEIVNALGQGTYAAQVCSDYEIDSQGNTPCQAGNACYDDWFLPSAEFGNPNGQLQCLYDNRLAIGNFVLNGVYWSSTEYDAANAFEIKFADSESEFGVAKVESYRVRCVRAFTPTP